MSFLSLTGTHLRFPKSFNRDWKVTFFEQQDKTLFFKCPACGKMLNCFKALSETLFPLYAFADKRFKGNVQLQVIMEAIIASIELEGEKRIFYRTDVVLPSEEITLGQVAHLAEWDLWDPPLFNILLKMKKVDDGNAGIFIIYDIMRKAQYISVLPLFYYLEKGSDGVFLTCDGCGSLITNPGV